MKSLYRAEAVRQRLGSCLRPGGVELTRHLLDLLDPAPGIFAFDAGCGAGASLALLREYGIRSVFGLDLDEALLREARIRERRLVRADLARLPLASGCLDLLLCECVWNLTDRKRVLAEWARVLRPGGRIGVTDIYARPIAGAQRTGAWPVRCCFSQATDLATVREMVAGHGFDITHVEDHSSRLRQTAAEFVFAHGSLRAFWQAVTGDAALAEAACTASADAWPGLFLLIAQRR